MSHNEIDRDLYTQVDQSFYLTTILQHLLTNQITPCRRFLLQNLIVTQLVKKCPAFYGTQMFIIVFRTARHWSLSWVRWIQSTPSHPTSLRSILISSHLRLGLRLGVFPSSFMPKILYKFHYTVEMLCMINWKGYGWKRLWLILRCHSMFCLQEQSKTTKNLRQCNRHPGRISKPAPLPEFESGALNAVPQLTCTRGNYCGFLGDLR
jgi:hypothetical protein